MTRTRYSHIRCATNVQNTCKKENSICGFPFFVLLLQPETFNNMNTEKEQTAILTINGSDGTGASGIQADIRTIQSLGGTALTAITTITMQNTLGIQEFYDLPAPLLARQVEAVMDDVPPRVVKIGLLRDHAQLDVLCQLLERYKPEWVVYDPIETTTRGERLVSEAMKEDISRRLLPLCHVVTSRIEVQSLTDWNVHGQRGIFAAAIATLLCLGYTREDAIREAVNYVNRQAALSHHLEGRGAERYNELLDLIARHSKKHNDVQYYAEQMNVSPRYLAQITRRMAQVSPKALIEQQLIKQLKVALGSSDMTIQQVAYEYGFNTQSHFTRFFKKLTGVTPTEFRRELRINN